MLPSLRRRLPPLAGRAQRKPSRSFDFNQVNLERLAIEGLARYVPRMPSALEALLGSLRARRRLCYRSYERRRHHVTVAWETARCIPVALQPRKEHAT